MTHRNDPTRYATDRPAVVLLSGGLDSATCLAVAKAEGYRPFALSFDYGQRQRIELDAARKIAESIGVERHVIMPIDLRAFGGSALTSDMEVPKGREEEHMGDDIPITYVPARNTVFLSFALAWAETLGATDLFIGVNAVDYSGYPDCRPAFIEAFTTLANLATKAGVEGARYRLHTPLIDLTKADIVRLGHRLKIDFALTHSCYDPAADGRACGACDACILRRHGFERAGIADPTSYVEEPSSSEFGR